MSTSGRPVHATLPLLILLCAGCAPVRASADGATATDRLLSVPPPLVVFDGVLLRSGFVFQRGDLDALRIARVEALAPAEAVRRWDAPAVDGAVVVTTREAADSVRPSLLMPRLRALLDHFARRDPAPPPVMNPPRGGSTTPGIVVLNGEVRQNNTATDSVLHGLNITRIEVFRGAEAAQLYGFRAWHGVIAITTRQ